MIEVVFLFVIVINDCFVIFLVYCLMLEFIKYDCVNNVFVKFRMYKVFLKWDVL